MELFDRSIYDVNANVPTLHHNNEMFFAFDEKAKEVEIRDSRIFASEFFADICASESHNQFLIVTGLKTLLLYSEKKEGNSTNLKKIILNVLLAILLFSFLENYFSTYPVHHQ